MNPVFRPVRDGLRRVRRAGLQTANQLTRAYRHILARQRRVHFFSVLGVRSDGYRVSPSDKGRRDRGNWPQPTGLRRKSAHTLLSSSTLEPPKPSSSASSEPISAQQRNHRYMSIRPRPATEIPSPGIGACPLHHTRNDVNGEAGKPSPLKRLQCGLLAHP